MKKMKWFLIPVLCALAVFCFFGCRSENQSAQWKHVYLSRNSDNYSDMFSFTVTWDPETGKYYLYDDLWDPDTPIKLRRKTVDALLAMELAAYPEEEERESPEDILILDDSSESLSVLDLSGNLSVKDASYAQIMQLYELLSPYVN